VTETVSQAIISGAIGIVLWAILYMGYYVGQIVSPWRPYRPIRTIIHGPCYIALSLAHHIVSQVIFAPFVPFYLSRHIEPLDSTTGMYRLT